MKKKLLSLLSIPIFAFGLGSCKQELQEPVRKDYNSWNVKLGYNYNIKDFDNDGKADAITNDHNLALFYVKEYKDKVDVIKKSQIMSPEMRQAATDFMKAYDELRYQRDKIEYDSKKENQNE